MNRTSINKKNLSNNRIYSDTVSLNLYNKTYNNVDDSRSVCIRNNNTLKKNSNENLRLSKSLNTRILSNLSTSQTRKNDFINKSQNKSISNLKKTKSQTNLYQSLVKPPIKQISKSINNTQQKPISKQNTQKCLNSSKNSNNKIQKNHPTQTLKPVKITPKIIQTTQPVIIKPVIQPKPNNQNNYQEQKIPKINNIMELNTNNQNLNNNKLENNQKEFINTSEFCTNKSITIKSPKNLDNYTEYNNSYIECVSDNSRYIIKPEYLTFQKATEYKSYYGIDQVKLSLIDKNQNTLTATIINPLLISTKEINLYTGSIEKLPLKENDIVNKKYVDDQILKMIDNEKVNKHITKLADQMNKNIDAINLINQRITKINNNISVNLKELNQKINENKNIFNDEIKNEIEKDFLNNSLVINSLVANEITVNKLIIPETFEHIKFNSILDCNNILLHKIDCMHNGTYNSLEIKLDNSYDLHFYDDDNNNFSFKPYSGIIESDNGLTLQKYGEYDENATKITSEDIMTKRIYLSDVDENGYKTDIIIRPFNIDGNPKLQLIMKCGDNEEIIYLP